MVYFLEESHKEVKVLGLTSNCKSIWFFWIISGHQESGFYVFLYLRKVNCWKLKSDSIKTAAVSAKFVRIVE